MRSFLIFLSICGMAIAALALRAHFAAPEAGCLVHGLQDCGLVEHSRYAQMAGAPIAAIGLAGYLTLLMLAILRRRGLFAATSLAGLVYSLYLSHIGISVLHLWPLACALSLTVITLLTGFGWWWAIATPPLPLFWKRWGRGACSSAQS